MLCLRKLSYTHSMSCYINKMCGSYLMQPFIHLAAFNFQYQQNLINVEKSDASCNKHLKELELQSTTQITKNLVSSQLYPNALADVNNIYSIVQNELNEECITFRYENIKNTRNHEVKCTINVTWPYKASFSYVETSKVKAKRNAAAQCLDWLYKIKKIINCKPIIYDQKTAQRILKSQNCLSINLESKFKDEIQYLIHTFDQKIKSMIDLSIVDELDDLQEKSSNQILLDEDFSNSTESINSKARTIEQIEYENNLPIIKYREEVLNALQNNQVLLIKGDTGCGKSTCIPQFILDLYKNEMKQHKCNILVAQPRRVSAVSLADYVAKERNEIIGDTVGYHVRFSKKIPPLHGSILYCTTGILLKKLKDPDTLKKVSHIILDEAHERSFHIDILLKMFKDMIESNSHIKFIIMSATMNTEIFEQYFSCKVIDVPGKIYPVKMHFMEDIDIFKNNMSDLNDSMKEEVSFKQVLNLILWIIENKPPGAILCFLPGWQEIKQLYKMLQNLQMNNLFILPLHSKMLINRQQIVFKPVPFGITKIILATDIAETGITIPDISYVIDTAVRRETKWNENNSLSTIFLDRISKASILQRKGRAGRVKPGESYHLLTRKEYDQLDLYPTPEILKISLDTGIIISKDLSDKKAHDFFKRMIEPPNDELITHTVNNLKALGILDNDENLTNLGKNVSNISQNPKLSKALVLSCIFQCLDPVLSITEISSTFKPSVSVNEKLNFKMNKMQFHRSSDHIAVSQYVDNLRHCKDQSMFSDIYDINILKTWQKLYKLRIEELGKNLISSNSHLYYENRYANNNELVRAVLFSATNQLLKINFFGIKNGYFARNANVLRSESNTVCRIKSDSVNYNRKIWPSELLTYIEKIKLAEVGQCFVSDTSMISPLSVLLFSSNDVQCEEVQDDDTTEEKQILIKINNLNNVCFLCDPETADLLLKFRTVLWTTVDFLLGDNNHSVHFKEVKKYKERLLYLLSEMLRKSSQGIDEEV